MLQNNVIFLYSSFFFDAKQSQLSPFPKAERISIPGLLVIVSIKDIKIEIYI